MSAAFLAWCRLNGRDPDDEDSLLDYQDEADEARRDAQEEEG